MNLSATGGSYLDPGRVSQKLFRASSSLHDEVIEMRWSQMPGIRRFLSWWFVGVLDRELTSVINRLRRPLKEDPDEFAIL
jgi:hypothetical protein